MTVSLVQNFFKQTVTTPWTVGTGNFYVSQKPSVTSGFLVISPNSESLREIVSFSAVGTDGGGDYVTVSARGLGGTTEQAHGAGERVYMNITAQHIEQIKQAIEDINNAGALNASTTVKGVARLTASPAVSLGNPTITIASPAVVTLTTHGLTENDEIQFTTDGNLPTGITPSATYYVIGTGLTTNTFQFSETFGGAAVNTSGSQSGTHTLTRTTPRALSENDIRVPSTNASQFINAVTGMITMYGSATPPTGFLLCDGDAYSFTTYSALFTVLGIQYGLGGTVAGVANAGTDSIDLTAHGYSNGQRLYITATSMPGGLAASTPYFVVNATANAFQLSTTVGGSAIDITSAGSNVFVNSQFRVPNLASRFPLGYSAGAPTKVATFVSRASNVITVSGIDSHAHNELLTGAAVFYNTTGTVITGLTNNTTYYVVRVTATTFSLATSVANANAGTVITLTGDGTGTQTFTQTYTVRPMGQTGGEESHALSDAEMPSHVHPIPNEDGSSGAVQSVTWTTDAGTAGQNTDPTGGDVVHNNMPLFTVVNYIIKT